jgi:hypothetical protein
MKNNLCYSKAFSNIINGLIFINFLKIIVFIVNFSFFYIYVLKIKLITHSFYKYQPILLFKLMKIFKNLDIIAPEIKLNVLGLESFKSTSGGILSIILAILSVLAFCEFGRDIIEKKSPIIQLNSKDNPDRVYHYNSDNFTIMFAVTDNNNWSPIKEVSRKMKLYFNIRNTNATNNSGATGSNLIDINHDLVPCTNEIVDPDVLPNLITDISYYWCVPRNISYDLINGLGEGTSQWIRVQMEICKNSTANNNTCYPVDDIYKEFTVINVHYVLTDFFIDGFDYSQPGKKTFISGLLKGGSNTWTRTVYWYKNIYYNTDTSWILESIKKQIYFQNNQLDKEIYYQEKTKVFFSHLISISKKADYFNRSYLKIQGVLAYIGGFITFFKFVFSFFNSWILKQDIYLIFDHNFNKTRSIFENKSSEIDNSKILLERSIENLKQDERKLEDKNKITYNTPDLKFSQKIKSEKKFSIEKFKFKKLNFIKYLFPCVIKSESDSARLYKILTYMKNSYSKAFSLEKVAKTIRNVQLIKKFINEEKGNSHNKTNFLKIIKKQNESFN